MLLLLLPLDELLVDELLLLDELLVDAGCGARSLTGKMLRVHDGHSRVYSPVYVHDAITLHQYF